MALVRITDCTSGRVTLRPCVFCTVAFAYGTVGSLLRTIITHLSGNSKRVIPATHMVVVPDPSTKDRYGAGRR